MAQGTIPKPLENYLRKTVITLIANAYGLSFKISKAGGSRTLHIGDKLDSNAFAAGQEITVSTNQTVINQLLGEGFPNWVIFRELNNAGYVKFYVNNNTLYMQVEKAYAAQSNFRATYTWTAGIS